MKKSMVFPIMMSVWFFDKSESADQEIDGDEYARTTRPGRRIIDVA